MAHIDPTVNHCSILLFRIKHQHTRMYTHTHTHPFLLMHLHAQTQKSHIYLSREHGQTKERKKADAVCALAVSLSTLVLEGIWRRNDHSHSCFFFVSYFSLLSLSLLLLRTSIPFIHFFMYSSVHIVQRTDEIQVLLVSGYVRMHLRAFASSLTIEQNVFSCSMACNLPLSSSSSSNL